MTATSVQLHGEPATGHVETFERTERHAGGIGRHEHLHDAVVTGRVDEQPRARRGVGHHRDGAGEAEPVAVGAHGARALGARGPRRPRRAARELLDHGGLRPSDRQRVHDDVVAHERTRLQPRTALGRDERGVEQAVARHRTAPVRLVGEHAEPAELGGGVPVGLVVVRLAVGAAPDGREGCSDSMKRTDASTSIACSSVGAGTRSTVMPAV